MFNLYDITNENNEEHNKKRLYILDHPYRMTIIKNKNKIKIKR